MFKRTIRIILIEKEEYFLNITGYFGVFRVIHVSFIEKK
jgi:hypothetical protein